MIKCSKCGQELDGKEKANRLASISGSIMGDEYIETFYFCNACGVYTVEIYHDRFSGEDSVALRGPVAKAEGDKQVRLIRQCKEPWNKKCRCKAHRAYFGSGLD